jgi:hypothetical protein
VKEIRGPLRHDGQKGSKGNWEFFGGFEGVMDEIDPILIDDQNRAILGP